MTPPAEKTNRVFLGQIALACGELAAARRWLDEAMSAVKGWWLSIALITRARVHLAAGNLLEKAESDAHEGLAIAARGDGRLSTPDNLEGNAGFAGHTDPPPEAPQRLIAANAARARRGTV